MSSLAGPALTGFLLVLLQGAQAGSVGLDESTRVQAAALALKIDNAQARAKVPVARRAPQRPVAVTQAELNAWLRSSPENRPKGVSEMAVRFEPQRLVVRGMLDITELKPKIELSPFNPLYWISGVVPVDVVGRVQSQNGRLTVTWEDVRIASVPVSATMLRDLVATATRGSRRYPGGLDITAPYEMPYDVKSIRLEAARALVDF